MIIFIPEQDLKLPQGSTLSENKLDYFTILSIEGDFVHSLNYDEIIDQFANAKSRRKL